ncbi:hypothetical protein COF40_29955 [Bacillus toyonensis]|uniref:SAM-dependent methyltransferase n=1 Tax=Bacillus toyonensis TaxID=155322 RepID=A0A2C4PU87_9BACI|nr:hypothetical protein COF40_29955 [Bacillus toyonensis]
MLPLKRKKEHTPLLLIEINERFAQTLHEKHKYEPNVHVIHGSAENIQQYIEEHNITKVDVVISGLPFSSLPNKISSLILLHVQKTLNKNGIFVTFQYSQIKKAVSLYSNTKSMVKYSACIRVYLQKLIRGVIEIELRNLQLPRTLKNWILSYFLMYLE